MTFKSILRLVPLAVCAALSLSAQQRNKIEKPVVPMTFPAPGSVPTPADVSPEARAAIMKRFDLAVDPGVDPDPKQELVRYGKRFHIEKFEKRLAKPSEREGWIKPFPYVAFTGEVYQEDTKYYWVFVPIREEERRGSPSQYTTPSGRTVAIMPYKPEELKLIESARPEFTPLVVPASPVAVRFEESSTGLPQDGSWRNSPDVADMNEDGLLDIITPAQRASVENEPSVFLADGKGGWKRWSEIDWPFVMNYGSVAAGDANGDGHTDLVFGIHQFGALVYLGDGKGHFTNSSEGLPQNYPTRRANFVDVDADGDLDVVLLSEGPGGGLQTLEKRGPESKLRVYLNEGKAKKWKLTEIIQAERMLGGDWLAVGNFNGDKYPDFAASSIVFSGPDTMYVSTGKMKYGAVGRGFLPFFSYYFSVTAGPFSSRKKDDVIASFLRYFPENADPAKVAHPEYMSVAGLERISWDAKGNPVRTAIERFPSDKAIWGLARGDFNGDGNQDLIYSRTQPREFVLLVGDGKGGFRKGSLPGMNLPPNVSYDIKVADLNRDKRPDLIVLFEEDGDRRNGGVRVYLNRGVEK